MRPGRPQTAPASRSRVQSPAPTPITGTSQPSRSNSTLSAEMRKVTTIVHTVRRSNRGGDSVSAKPLPLAAVATAASDVKGCDGTTSTSCAITTTTARGFKADLMSEQDGGVFRAVGRQLVEHAMTGIDACVFACGAAGAGKTRAMFGGAGAAAAASLQTTPNADAANEARDVDDGLVPQFLSALFDAIGRRAEDDFSWSARVQISFLEVHNDRVRDLLADSVRTGRTESGGDPTRRGTLAFDGGRVNEARAAVNPADLEVATVNVDAANVRASTAATEPYAVTVRGLSVSTAATAARAVEIVRRGTEARKSVKATPPYDVPPSGGDRAGTLPPVYSSSRSHVIVSVRVSQEWRRVADEATEGLDATLLFCDLAPLVGGDGLGIANPHGVPSAVLAPAQAAAAAAKAAEEAKANRLALLALGRALNSLAAAPTTSRRRFSDASSLPPGNTTVPLDVSNGAAAVDDGDHPVLSTAVAASGGESNGPGVGNGGAGFMAAVRESKLTRLLAAHLHGPARVYVICVVSDSPLAAADTAAVLDFASQFQRVPPRPVRINRRVSNPDDAELTERLLASIQEATQDQFIADVALLEAAESCTRAICVLEAAAGARQLLQTAVSAETDMVTALAAQDADAARQWQAAQLAGPTTSRS